MSTEVFEAKSGAKLAELAPQSEASVAGRSRGLGGEHQNASQKGLSKVSATMKLSIMLNYVLYLLDYTGTSNILSNACIVQCLLKGCMYTLLGMFT